MLSNNDPGWVRAEVIKYVLIFLAIGIFSGLTNFVTVKLSDTKIAIILFYNVIHLIY